MKDLHSDGEHYTPTSLASIITNNQLYLNIKRLLEAEIASHFSTGNLLIRKSKKKKKRYDALGCVKSSKRVQIFLFP